MAEKFLLTQPTRCTASSGNYPNNEQPSGVDKPLKYQQRRSAMKHKKYSGSQITAILKEAAHDVNMPEPC
jgi:hypothetical protein